VLEEVAEDHTMLLEVLPLVVEVEVVIQMKLEFLVQQILAEAEAVEEDKILEQAVLAVLES
jgi:hypothetical protein